MERETYKGHEAWSITLSFPAPGAPVAKFLERLGPPVDLLRYKRFLIDVETGEMLAMRIREVASQ